LGNTECCRTGIVAMDICRYTSVSAGVAKFRVDQTERVVSFDDVLSATDSALVSERHKKCVQSWNQERICKG